jgi:hypothetical protein
VSIPTGYRVKSAVATRFRIWATRQLREYNVKGFLLDDERLKNPDQPFDYFGELMRRIQDIRTSGRRFYQKITDIDARSQFCSKRARGATTPHRSGHTPNPEAWFTSTIKTVAEPALATFSTILRAICKATATKCTRHWVLTGKAMQANGRRPDTSLIRLARRRPRNSVCREPRGIDLIVRLYALASEGRDTHLDGRARLPLRQERGVTAHLDVLAKRLIQIRQQALQASLLAKVIPSSQKTGKLRRPELGLHPPTPLPAGCDHAYSPTFPSSPHSCVFIAATLHNRLDTS